MKNIHVLWHFEPKKGDWAKFLYQNAPSGTPSTIEASNTPPVHPKTTVDPETAAANAQTIEDTEAIVQASTNLPDPTLVFEPDEEETTEDIAFNTDTVTTNWGEDITAKNIRNSVKSVAACNDDELTLANKIVKTAFAGQYLDMAKSDDYLKEEILPNLQHYAMQTESQTKEDAAAWLESQNEEDLLSKSGIKGTLNMLIGFLKDFGFFNDEDESYERFENKGTKIIEEEIEKRNKEDNTDDTETDQNNTPNTNANSETNQKRAITGEEKAIIKNNTSKFKSLNPKFKNKFVFDGKTYEINSNGERIVNGKTITSPNSTEIDDKTMQFEQKLAQMGENWSRFYKVDWLRAGFSLKALNIIAKTSGSIISITKKTDNSQNYIYLTSINNTLYKIPEEETEFLQAIAKKKKA